jgi:hydrogenase-4 component B
MRVIMTVMHFSLPFWVGLVIIALGLFSGVFGALKAATETDIKKTLAWSSVENLGLMFAMAGTVVFLANIGAYGAASVIWIALFIHALNHSIFKSGLFMAAGAIVSETHTRDADELGGLANKWPLFSKIFLGLSLAAAALPPLGTFYGEWLFLQTLASGIASSGILTGVILVVIISAFAMAAGLAVFAFVKLFSGVFLSKPRSEHAEHVNKLPAGLVAPVAAALVLSLFLGLLLPLFMKGIWPDAKGMLFTGLSVSAGDISVTPILIALFICGAIAVAWILRRFFMRKGAVKTDTWDCGTPLTPRMEYTPYAFAAPIRFFFRSLTLPWKKMTVKAVSAENPWINSRSLEHGETALAEKYAYGPIAKVVGYVSLKVKRLQNGVVQFYIALIFIALIVTLIVAL